MKKTRILRKQAWILIILAAILLILNLADVITTWVAVSTGRGVEENPFVLMLGGPFTPAALFLKLIVVPGAVLSVAWYLARRFKDPRLGMALIAPVAMYAAVVTNNVMVAAKKVEKTAKKVKKTVANEAGQNFEPTKKAG